MNKTVLLTRPAARPVCRRAPGWLWLVLLLPSLAVAQSQPLYMLDDPEGRLSLIDLLAAWQGGEFTPLKGALNRGYLRNATWLAVELKPRDRGQDYFLWLSPPYVNEVTLYLQHSHRADTTQPQSYQRILLGDHVPMSERPLFHPHFVLPIDLAWGESRMAFIRVRTNSNHVLRVDLLLPHEMQQRSFNIVASQGGFALATLIVAIINIMLALRRHDDALLYFGLYLLTTVVLYTTASGISALIIPDTIHLYSDWLIGLGMGLGFTFFALHAVYLFQSAAYESRYFHLSLWLTSMLGLLLIPFAGGWGYGTMARVLLTVGIVMLILIIWHSYQLMRSMRPAGIFYFASFLILATGAIINFLQILGLIPHNPYTFSSLQISTLIHMTLTSFALNHLRTLRDSLALESSREAEARASSLAQDKQQQLVIQQAKLEEALAREIRSREDQQRFIELISHQYRTPLAVIATNLEILRLKMADTPQIRENIDRIDNANVALRDLFENSLSKNHLLGSGNVSPQAEPICQLVAAAVSAISQQWRREIDLRIAVDVEAAEAFIDRRLMRIALDNLLENACKYSPAATPIVVEIAGKEELIELIFSNAIDPRVKLNLEQLFDKYARGTNVNGHAGMGLGLYIVRSIVERHHGTISARITLTQRIEISLYLPRYLAHLEPNRS
jgi:two-component system, sensor histidine kinase LadS